MIARNVIQQGYAYDPSGVGYLLDPGETVGKALPLMNNKAKGANSDGITEAKEPFILLY